MTASTITIDEKTYDIKGITPQGKEILLMVQATDKKLAELNTEIAMIKTAKLFYLRSLVQHLPAPMNERS